MGWYEFAYEYSIPIDEKRSRGGNLYTRCPFCLDDPSSHLGLSKSSSEWGCLRNDEHRGRRPHRLIKALLKCSTSESILAGQRFFEYALESVVTHKSNEIAPCPIPGSFREFNDDDLTAPLQNQFREYMKSRGLDAHYLSSRFDIRWCISGRYRDRLILPIIYRKAWYGWTGRAINDNSIRYKTADEKDNACSPDNFLFNWDHLTGGKNLLIVEGPFDALTLTSAMVPFLSATALFGMNLSDRQLKLLLEVSNKYENVYLSLDKAEMASTQQIMNRLRWYIPGIRTLSAPSKDWGATDHTTIKRIFTCSN